MAFQGMWFKMRIKPLNCVQNGMTEMCEGFYESNKAPSVGGEEKNNISWP
jgi:hypothetical protein